MKSEILYKEKLKSAESSLNEYIPIFTSEAIFKLETQKTLETAFQLSPKFPGSEEAKATLDML